MCDDEDDPTTTAALPSPPLSTTFMLRRVARRESSLVVLDDDEVLVKLGRGLRFGACCAADAKYDAGLNERLAISELCPGEFGVSGRRGLVTVS